MAEMKVTPEIKSEFVALYNQGESTTSIGRTYSLHPSTVADHLKRAGVKMRKGGGLRGGGFGSPGRVNSTAFPRTKTTPEMEQEMINLYNAGETMPAIGRAYGLHSATVRYYLLRGGVRLRRRGGAGRFGIDRINHAAFDKITEESAYWIGFLMADGCVSWTGPHSAVISLCLAAVDRSHLDRFHKFLALTNKIYQNKSNGAWMVHASSTHIARRLAKFGVVPRKTFIAQVKHLENNRHFWRGVIDGDGSIFVRENRHPQISLVGFKTLLQQFLSFASTITPHRCSTRPHHGKDNGIHKTAISAAPAIRVIRALYEDCTIALPRKLETAKKLLDSVALL